MMSFPVERNIVFSTENDIFFSCKNPFDGVSYLRSEKKPERRKKRRKCAMSTKIMLFPHFSYPLLRKILCYFFEKQDMQKVMALSRKMDAMQIAYWKKRGNKIEN